ncbi:MULTISPECIES: hypothetical protein [unclassified Streptomyces]|jgi:hypothetical protein|uniref:hypothetical protein n=1 Tax=unclassified Streptomyces TaxID=2593676 RepID=UPI002DDB5EE1|nr:hypothetical protein [Streptomyces sp. NBC_01800]WSA73123.1 hypothetical protein OIE65_43330 [Streptomyces sp. NBC_01800]
MSAPIVVHRPSLTGGRAVTINDEIVGLVYDDQGLIELLRRAGLYDAENCLEDPHWIEWRGGWPHRYRWGYS